MFQINWHSHALILAQSSPYTANPYLLYYVQLKLCKSAAPVGAADFYFNAKVVVLIHTFLQTARKTLKNQRGEANYFSTVVFIFIGGFMFFGSNDVQTEQILPSFSVHADSSNVQFVSQKTSSLEQYSLEEILEYLDSKGYDVDISIRGIEKVD